MEEEIHLSNCVVTQNGVTVGYPNSWVAGGGNGYAPSHLGWTCDDKLGSAFEDRYLMMIMLRIRNIMRITRT